MKEFYLSEKNQSINFYKVGKYKLFFIGGFTVENIGDFRIGIKHKSTGEYVDINYNWIQARTWVNGKRAVHYASFRIEEEGGYDITFYNVDELRVRKSMLKLMNLIFPITVNNDEVVVRISAI